MNNFSFAQKAIFGLSVFLLVSNYSIAQKSGSEETIRLNQIGFYPYAQKKAVIEQDASGPFYVNSAETGKRVYSGSLSEPRSSQYGDKVVRIADFSNFNQRGEYKLKIPSVGTSFSFRIAPNVLAEVADASLKAYYYQRASSALPEKYAGKWHRKAGHPDDSVQVHSSAATTDRPQGAVINSSKGWYDAGDYNKYVVNSGITMATLMSFYEDFPAYAKQIDTAIPENNNEIPDLLDEVLWNLRWMFTMQDPQDGGVYHKMTSAGFSDMVMPAEDEGTRYVIQKSTPATLDFAAVMAQAARIFNKYEQTLPNLVDSCLSAANNAWEWAQDNPNRLYNQRQMNEQFDPDITTGAYGDRRVRDEFDWAAIELFVTTGNQDYLEAADISPNQVSIPSWSQVQTMGYYTLLRFRNKLDSSSQKAVSQVQKKIIEEAERLVQGGNKMAYQTVMGHEPGDFIWGSNSVAGNQAILLIQAYKLTSDKKYLDAALSNIDYLLGRNATGYSFVTGYGDKTPMHPHHRPSVADNIAEPVPGLLVGGPNPRQQDGCNYPSNLPDESYSETICSYASNEIAINWNAPLVYVLYAMEALQANPY